MHPSKGLKVVAAVLGTGTGITAGATATAVIDRYGYDDVRIVLVSGSVDVVSNTPTALKVQDSDTTDATNYGNITPLTGGTAGNTSGFFTIPTNAITTGTNTYVIDVDCRGRKRYLKLSWSPRTTQEAVVVAELYRAKETPVTTTAEGVGLHVHG